jgi:hypothetical protein
MKHTYNGEDYYGQAEWHYRDIQRIKPEWSKEKCVSFLVSVEDKLIDCMTEEGWLFLHEEVKKYEDEEDYVS